MEDFGKMDRRSLMERAMLMLGAGAIAGFEIVPAQAAPMSLSPPRMATLKALADTLVPQTDTPGAITAGVPAVLGAMFRDWASAGTRAALGGALDRLDAAARKDAGTAFAALGAPQRKAFLIPYDKAAMVDVPLAPDAKKSAGNPFVPVISVADTGYAVLKDLIATVHYSTEVALTADLVYEHVPGPWQPSVQITPGMRPAVSFGAF